MSRNLSTPPGPDVPYKIIDGHHGSQYEWWLIVYADGQVGPMARMTDMRAFAMALSPCPSG